MPIDQDPSFPDPQAKLSPYVADCPAGREAGGVLRSALLVLLALLLLCAQAQLSPQLQRVQRSDDQRWAAPLCCAIVSTSARTSGNQGRLRHVPGLAPATELPTAQRRAGTSGGTINDDGPPKGLVAAPVGLTLFALAMGDNVRAALPPRNDLLRSECARRGMRTSGRHPPI